MTFGMNYKTTPVFLSSKTNDRHNDGGTDDVKSSREAAKGKRNSAPLPRIRVEECGLTVDMRRKAGGHSQHQKDATDSKTSKANPKVGTRSDTRNEDSESQNAPHRARWFGDAREVSNGQTSVMESSISTEFVDSLRIGKADGHALTRGQALPGPFEPRPVPRIRYSKGAPHGRSIGDAVDTFQTRRAASMGAFSSRERVVIRRLAAKRSETALTYQDFPQTADRSRRSSERLQRATWRDRRYHSQEDTRSRLGMVSRKYKRGGSSHSDEFDFHLTYMNPDDMVRELRCRSGVDLLGGDLLDKTRQSTPGQGGGSSGVSDGTRIVHSVDCPMCHLYEPSRFGHVCPPNTPLDQPGNEVM